MLTLVMLVCTVAAVPDCKIVTLNVNAPYSPDNCLAAVQAFDAKLPEVAPGWTRRHTLCQPRAVEQSI